MFSVHCHNDLGLATANALAAVEAGARRVECTINGIGERAGNTSLEEIVMLLRVRASALGLETAVDTTEIAATSRMLVDLTGVDVQPNKAIVGANAFAHASGIHQDGVLKDRLNYEIMRPEDVGFRDSRIVLTARSGRHAFRHRLMLLGIALPDAAVQSAWERFLAVADTKREVSDDDLREIAAKIRVA
jgi:2-isopropylmalate synthase